MFIQFPLALRRAASGDCYPVEIFRERGRDAGINESTVATRSRMPNFHARSVPSSPLEKFSSDARSSVDRRIEGPKDAEERHT